MDTFLVGPDAARGMGACGCPYPLEAPLVAALLADTGRVVVVRSCDVTADPSMYLVLTACVLLVLSTFVLACWSR